MLNLLQMPSSLPLVKKALTTGNWWVKVMTELQLPLAAKTIRYHQFLVSLTGLWSSQLKLPSYLDMRFICVFAIDKIKPSEDVETYRELVQESYTSTHANTHLSFQLTYSLYPSLICWVKNSDNIPLTCGLVFIETPGHLPR